MKGILVLCLSCILFSTFAQENSEQKRTLEFSGFLDFYYGFDFNRPAESKRFPFLYNHTRHDQFALNLGLLSATYRSIGFRANLALQRGTYVADNYSLEPKALRWIHQANIGLALNPKQNLWLDVGIMPSHIGFESAVSTENLTLSRSLVAENSPYFETGAKLGWSASEKWDLALFYLIGWQRIKGIEGKNKPSFGTQAIFRPSEKASINWSTFLGTNDGIELNRMLYFSNFYGNFKLGSRWKLISGFDLGWRTQEASPTAQWWGFSAIASYSWSENLSSAFRWEHYADQEGVIAQAFFGTGLQTSGYSINVDRKMGKWGMIRLESRWLISPKESFLRSGDSVSDNFFLLGSFAVQID
ncbi:porin [Algoriphagus sp. CAU 1675]|uniref:porin n=1 Tax=Algoriphagus sp. CAU 1675 TaxID=3032597 RepID=UPI0023D9D2BF|nr:porin [Algoriphagus sp. CAU 1675]MDF2156585.1 porin [Algoriphagus sp. CAU 1675]